MQPVACSLLALSRARGSWQDIFAKGVHGQIPHGKDRKVYEAILAGEPVDYARGPRRKRALLDVDGEVGCKPKQKRSSGHM